MKTLQVILTFLPIFTFAQSMQTEWEHTFGGSSAEKIHGMMEATNGNLITVGESSSNTLGGKDGYVVIYDYLGQTVMQPRGLGGRKDDVLNDVVQSFDGKFWMVGRTSSKGLGKSDGWLVKINVDGSGFEEQTFGSPNEDKLEGLVVLEDGSVILVGEKNEGKSGDIWLIKIEREKLIWDKNIGNNQYENVKSVAPTHDGGFVVCGNSKSSKGDIYLLKIDKNGKEVWSKTYGEKGWEEAKEVVFTKDNGFAISGWTRSKGNGGMDCWLVKIDEEGFKQWDRAFGGRDDDEALALTQTNNEDYFLIGKTKSHTPGARQYNVYLLQINANGIMKREISDFGGKKEECGKAILQMHDGSLVWAAETESQGNGGYDAWVMKFKSKELALSAGARPAGVVSTSAVTLHTHDGKLKQDDKTYLSFDLKNNENIDLNNVQIRMDGASGAKGIKVWQRSFIGQVAGSSIRTIQIPVEAGENLQSGDNEFNVTITSGDTKLDAFSLVLESKVAKPAEILAEDSGFIGKDMNDEMVEVEVKNGGDFASQPIIVIFKCDTGMKPLSDLKVALGKIPPGGTKMASFNFQVTDDFRGTKPSVVYSILEGGAEKIKKTAYPNGGSSTDFLIAWIGKYDEAEVDIGNIRVDEPFIEGKVKIFSKSPTSREDFRVIKNGLALDGSKMDSDVLSPPKSERGLVTQNFERRIKLVEGENRIKVQVETSYGTYESKEMIVFYDPQRPNLHLLTIGVKHQDLKFTGKDATDISRVFAQQEGKLFDKVYTTELVGEAATTKAKIVRTLAKFRNRYTNTESPVRIHDRDVVMVFISSHGSVSGTDEDKRFRLRPSDFDVEIPLESSIDYRSEVLAKLEEINCKKLIMIDACHSGGAKGALSEALVKINQTASGLSTMTSCQSGELSYEDDNWENGAFTEALIDGLNNGRYEDTNGNYRADANQDNSLTLKELYDFLRRRVPQLVRTKTDATTTQIPFMPAKQLDGGMPIFVWE